MNELRDPATTHIFTTVHEAVAILDASEPMIRDLIETRLMDVAGINRTKVSDAMLTRDELTRQIINIRTQHIKAAFKHLRDNLPSDL
jgi:hypothetical protein